MQVSPTWCPRCCGNQEHLGAHQVFAEHGWSHLPSIGNCRSVQIKIRLFQQQLPCVGFIPSLTPFYPVYFLNYPSFPLHLDFLCVCSPPSCCSHFVVTPTTLCQKFYGAPLLKKVGDPYPTARNPHCFYSAVEVKLANTHCNTVDGKKHDISRLCN